MPANGSGHICGGAKAASINSPGFDARDGRTKRHTSPKIPGKWLSRGHINRVLRRREQRYLHPTSPQEALLVLLADHNGANGQITAGQMQAWH